jgi:hypothetical protein
MLFPTSVFQYEQRGWEKFFTVKQRGICLLVINFTLIIYHVFTCIGKLFVWYFTILSKSIHVRLLYLIYMVIRQRSEGIDMLAKMKYGIFLLLILISFFINILGLMHLVPVYITSPILFLSLLLFIHSLGNRNRFRGFKSMK